MQDTTSVGQQPSSDIEVSKLIEFLLDLPDPALYVAVTAALLVYVIGWFGGTKHQVSKVVISTVFVTLIGFFGLPIPAFVLKFMLAFAPAIPSIILVYTFYVAFLLGMAISLYETWTVTQEEMRVD